MKVEHEVTEVILNYHEFTIVTVKTPKGSFQMSVTGHNQPRAKTSRMAESILKSIK
ncbi:hypothetical protein D6_0124 [Aeromonas phage D6]|uniref:Uncharacterized protein n=1 Tax=Aeromonas phage D6 TaxID=2593322 RepID=A0A514TW99_9CAUD|nr:hypothetical protein PQC08_gp151 [Aeromonas phage D6]QDJ97284.1 hypothetical protein D6_0124 [Aeromonas phage D6]